MPAADFEKIMEFLATMDNGRHRQEINEELYLPRYKIVPILNVFKRKEKISMLLLFMAVLLLSGISVGRLIYDECPVHRIPLLIMPALIFYAAIAIITWFQRESIAVFTLRVPASNAVGLLFLIGILTDLKNVVLPKIPGMPFWHIALIVLGILGISGLYLAYELDGHGVRITKGNRGLLAKRVLCGLAIIAWHSFILSLFMVGVIEYIAESTIGGGDTVVKLVFLLMVFLMLVGIFSQIIWDEETIFSPISHKKWRRG
jgi:hypothetical protein